MVEKQIDEFLERLGYQRGATQTLVSFVLDWTALLTNGIQHIYKEMNHQCYIV